jgi:hypothetical protein
MITAAERSRMPLIEIILNGWEYQIKSAFRSALNTSIVTALRSVVGLGTQIVNFRTVDNLEIGSWS